MAEIKVCSVDDLPEGSSKVVKAGEREIAVFNISGEFFAIDNTCPHRGGPLGEGFVSDGVVSCPLHAWEFDVKTGVCKFNPSVKVQTYEVEVRGDEIILLV